MKKLLIVGLLLSATSTWAVEIPIFPPASAGPGGTSMCEKLRVQLRVDPAVWSSTANGRHALSRCAEVFFYNGLRTFTAQQKRDEAEATAEQAVADETALFDVAYPSSGIVVSSFCGDGKTDVFDAFNEQCDDGNQDSTDACTVDCTTAVCGDGFVQAGVEQCDDGNVADGDGCSATCTTE